MVLKPGSRCHTVFIVNHNITAKIAIEHLTFSQFGNGYRFRLLPVGHLSGSIRQSVSVIVAAVTQGIAFRRPAFLKCIPSLLKLSGPVTHRIPRSIIQHHISGKVTAALVALFRLSGIQRKWRERSVILHHYTVTVSVIQCIKYPAEGRSEHRDLIPQRLFPYTLGNTVTVINKNIAKKKSQKVIALPRSRYIK